MSIRRGSAQKIMILFNQDVLFIHNPKTAGTSMLQYLEKTLRPPIYRAGVKEVGSNHPSLSLALGYACALTKRRPDDFKRIICAMRNPFEREISMYLYFRDVLDKSSSASENLNNADALRSVRMAGRLRFSDYLSWVWQEFGTCDIWRSKFFYRTAQGRSPKNLFIVRTEYIEADLTVALTEIEILPTNASFPRLNVSERGATEIDFSVHARSLVAQSYRWMSKEGFYTGEIAAALNDFAADR